jgi:transcription initiation factor TFIID subunit 12
MTQQSASPQPAPATPTTPNPGTVAASTPNPAFRVNDNVQPPASLDATNPAESYPAISSTLNTQNPGPVHWAQTRPTLTGGLASGRVSGKRSHCRKSLYADFLFVL